MFNIARKHINGLDAIELSDEALDNIVLVLPANGALLHTWHIAHAGKKLNIIDHYEDVDELTNSQAQKGFLSAKLSPFVCRLKNGEYNFAGQSYKTGKFYLNEHALHGLIYDCKFDVTAQHADAESAFVKMESAYRGEDQGYPFCYNCIVRYTLQKNNTLTITTTIINKDKGHIPIADGWHPYFTFDEKIDRLQLEIQSKEILEFDDSMIPTGKLIPYREFGSLKMIGNKKMDDCFTVNFAECQPMLVLRDPKKKLQLEIFPGRSYPYIQVYTPDHRRSIAIENLSAAPDAFNNHMGLVTLAPGEEKIFSTDYVISKLPKT